MGLHRGMILQKTASIRQCFYAEVLQVPTTLRHTEMRLQREAFRCRRVCTQVPLRGDVFTHRCFYTLICSHHAFAYKFFHAHKYLCTDILWHALAGAFVQTLWYCNDFFTEVFFLAHAHVHALSRGCIKHTCFYNAIFLHRDTLTHRCHYKQRFSYKRIRSWYGYRRSFYKPTFWCRHSLTWFPTADAHFARKSPASRCKVGMSAQILIIEMHAFLKGKQNCSSAVL